MNAIFRWMIRSVGELGESGIHADGGSRALMFQYDFKIALGSLSSAARQVLCGIGGPRSVGRTQHRLQDAMTQQTHSHDFSGSPWRFNKSHTALVFVCDCVFRDVHPLSSVHHDDEGDWQFLCGEAEHTAAKPHMVCLGCIIERHPGLAELADLPINAWAVRPGPDQPWER